MTANVFEKDRRTCLEAGMQDFVAKPVIPENLFSMLVKWLPRNANKISFHTHKLKSSARTVGADHLADLCFALELAGKNEDWTEIHGLSGGMRPAMDQVAEYINSF